MAEQTPLQTCPRLAGAFELFGKRWNAVIIDVLLQRPARFAELSRAVPGLSQRVLSERLRELAEARNTAEHTAYESEKRLKEMDEQLDAATKGELETAQKEVRDALESEDVEAIRQKTDGLNSIWHRVSEQMYERAQAEQAATAQATDATSENGASSSSSDEEVVDAEVVDEQK